MIKLNTTVLECKWTSLSEILTYLIELMKVLCTITAVEPLITDIPNSGPPSNRCLAFAPADPHI